LESFRGCLHKKNDGFNNIPIICFFWKFYIGTWKFLC